MGELRFGLVLLEPVSESSVSSKSSFGVPGAVFLVQFNLVWFGLVWSKLVLVQDGTSLRV